MLDVKKLFTKILDALRTKQLAPNIVTTTGTTVSSAVYRFGNVITVHVAFRKTTSTAVGGFVYQATFANIPKPKGSVTTACYYGARCLAAQMSTSGIIYIRNTYSSAFAFEGSDYAGCSFTYIVD